MDLSSLEKRLGISFKNKELLEQAFIHRSYLNENRDFHLPHNERLEFLGDAVLELVVTEYLFQEYPDKPEGELTAWRAALVNTKMLSAIGHELDFNSHLLLSHGEAKEEGQSQRLHFGKYGGGLYWIFVFRPGLEKCREIYYNAYTVKTSRSAGIAAFRRRQIALPGTGTGKGGHNPFLQRAERVGARPRQKLSRWGVSRQRACGRRRRIV